MQLKMLSVLIGNIHRACSRFFCLCSLLQDFQQLVKWLCCIPSQRNDTGWGFHLIWYMPSHRWLLGQNEIVLITTSVAGISGNCRSPNSKMSLKKTLAQHNESHVESFSTVQNSALIRSFLTVDCETEQQQRWQPGKKCPTSAAYMRSPCQTDPTST